MKKILLLVTCVVNGFLANAGIMPADSSAPAPGKFTFSGYMDTYYTANFNNPLDRLNTGVNGAARAFDQRAGQFQLGLIQDERHV